MDNEPFSNPLAPPSAPLTRSESNNYASERSQPLTNDDFRKLMMTPRAVMHNQSSTPGSVRGSIRNKHARSGFKSKVEQNENIRKKKKIYEIIRKQDGDVLHELAKKYRDRAKERRDGTTSTSGKGFEILPNTAYHAVGPDNFDMDAAERRKQLIQESKYLGGDMEHTHLVKGLDYALLQKVKAEIQSKEEEGLLKRKEEEEEAKKEEEQKKKSLPSKKSVEVDSFDDQDRYVVKNKKIETLLKIVFNKNLPEKNELFMQGRMAYQYDLTNEFMENEIPTTIIRSKAECPNLDVYNSISTNEIILNKLIQIFTYIRQGASKKQRKKLESSNKNDSISKTSEKEKPKFNDNIYDDIDEYIPDIKSKRNSSIHHSSKEEKRKSYFQSNSKYEDDFSSSQQLALESSASVGNFASTSNLPKVKKTKLHHEPESYAECYPGAPENDDAILDSDDETDYDQIDKSNSKKAQTNRWDFDNIEDYSDYIANKEVMPKAVFQYNLKTSDGRKTRRLKDEKAKLDREYQKINALINKKKETGEKIGMSYISEHYK